MVIDMKFKQIVPIFCLSLSAFGCSLVASEQTDDSQSADEIEVVSVTDLDRLKIHFIAPEDYTDIRPSNQSRVRFQERVIESFAAHFADLAQKLPEGHTLEVEVHDIDLAGDTRSARFQIGSLLEEIRVIEDIFFPSMAFSYSVKDSTGKEIQTDKVDIKDMTFLNRANRFPRRDMFPYEKFMLNDWFNRTFEREVS